MQYFHHKIVRLINESNVINTVGHVPVSQRKCNYATSDSMPGMSNMK